MVIKSIAERRQEGFTLIELMIVVAIIGILASVAIPSFSRYQNRARRAESFANLAALASAQKSYFAEYGLFIGAEMVPSTVTGVNPGTTQRESTTIATEFASVGWYIEGNVYYDYDTNTGGFGGGGGCACATCFTSTAYGDVDGDGSVALIMLTHPNVDQTDACSSLYFSAQGIPQIRNGSTVYDEPVLVVGADDF